MTSRYKSPGVSRENRISEEGLLRLEKQLISTVKISQMVLDQWVLRYGEPAQQLINKYRKSEDKTDK